jgi:ribosomal protein L17
MSAFADAISASMVAGLDPMNGMVKDYASAVVTKVKVETTSNKLEAISEIAAKLQLAKDNSADGRVVQAYSDLLDEIRSL